MSFTEILTPETIQRITNRYFGRSNVETQEEADSGLPQICVCDFANRGEMSDVEQRVAEGHFNEANGYCCPHHGNTCGSCQQYE